MKRKTFILTVVAIVALLLFASAQEACTGGNCLESEIVTLPLSGSVVTLEGSVIDMKKFCPICKEHGLKSSV